MHAFTDLQLRYKLVTSLIFPLFDYGAAVYGDLPGVLDSRLQVALNSCLRFVCGLGWRDHVSPSRLELHWLTTRNRRLYLSTRLLHKTLLTSTPDYLSTHIQIQVPPHPPRCVGPQLKIQFSSSQLLQDSFLTHTSNFWNSLPPPPPNSDKPKQQPPSIPSLSNFSLTLNSPRKPSFILPNPIPSLVELSHIASDPWLHKPFVFSQITLYYFSITCPCFYIYFSPLTSN